MSLKDCYAELVTLHGDSASDQLGLTKVAKLMLVDLTCFMIVLTKHPEKLYDRITKTALPEELKTRILEAKTMEELETIPELSIIEQGLEESRDEDTKLSSEFNEWVEEELLKQKAEERAEFVRSLVDEP